MSNFTDFFPAAGGGGGGIPKYQEFTSSGTFTPTQALIDAGGRLAFIIVGGGERGSGATAGGAGGEVIWGYQTLTGKKVHLNLYNMDIFSSLSDFSTAALAIRDSNLF